MSVLAASAVHNALHDWLTYVSIIVGILGTLYIRIVYPTLRDHKKHEAERTALRAENARLETERNTKLNDIPDRVGLIEWWIAMHEKAAR